MKPVDLNTLPPYYKDMIFEVVDLVVNKIGGSFRYYSTKTTKTVIMEWNGPMPNKDDVNLSIKHMILRRATADATAKAIIKKYNDAAKVTKVLVNAELMKPITKEEFNTISKDDLRKRLKFAIENSTVEETTDAVTEMLWAMIEPFREPKTRNSGKIISWDAAFSVWREYSNGDAVIPEEGDTVDINESDPGWLTAFPEEFYPRISEVSKTAEVVRKKSKWSINGNIQSRH